MQEILKRNGCYDGAVDGVNGNNTQGGLDRFLDNAGKKGNAKPGRIELAKATVGDFETWLKDADAIKGSLCTPPPKPKPEPEAKPARKEPVARRPDPPARQSHAAAVLLPAAVWWWRGPDPGHPITEDCINRRLHGPLEFPGACAIYGERPTSAGRIDADRACG